MPLNRAASASYRGRLHTSIARSRARCQSCAIGKSLNYVIEEAIKERGRDQPECPAGKHVMLEESPILRQANAMIDARYRMEDDMHDVYRRAFRRLRAKPPKGGSIIASTGDLHTDFEGLAKSEQECLKPSVTDLPKKAVKQEQKVGKQETDRTIRMPKSKSAPSVKKIGNVGKRATGMSFDSRKSGSIRNQQAILSGHLNEDTPKCGREDEDLPLHGREKMTRLEQARHTESYGQWLLGESGLLERDAFLNLDEWRDAYENDEVAVREDVLRAGNPALFPFRATIAPVRCSTAPVGTSRYPLCTRPNSSSSQILRHQRANSLTPSQSQPHFQHFPRFPQASRPTSSSASLRLGHQTTASVEAWGLQHCVRPKSSPSGELAHASSMASIDQRPRTSGQDHEGAPQYTGARRIRG